DRLLDVLLVPHVREPAVHRHDREGPADAEVGLRVRRIGHRRLLGQGNTGPVNGTGAAGGGGAWTCRPKELLPISTMAGTALMFRALAWSVMVALWSVIETGELIRSVPAGSLNSI